MSVTDLDPRQLDDLGNFWINRGIALLKENSRSSLQEAVVSFDHSIRLRSALPLTENIWFRYGLCAGWLNRADALTRLGGPGHLEEALTSFARAFEHLKFLPTEGHVLFKKRHAIAWLNQGVALLTKGSGPSLGEAIHSFDQVISLLKDDLEDSSETSLILASAWLHRSNTLLEVSPGNASQAGTSGEKALRLAVLREQQDLSAAETGFKARLAICRTISHMLETPEDSHDKVILVNRAADLVHDGLALGRFWELKGRTQLRFHVYDLFRFGARLHQILLPQDLAEFLLETLDPSRSPGAPSVGDEIYTLAIEVLWNVLGEFQRKGFKSFASTEFKTLLEQMGEIRTAETRLNELRNAVV